MRQQPQLFAVASHSNQGKDFEADLDATHDWYRLQGWADVRKIPSSWRFISRDAYNKILHAGNKSLIAETGDGRCMQRVKSDVDFVGGGEKFSICFDAKVCSGKIFPLGNVENHQLRKMKDRARCRVIAGALVYMSFYDRVFFAPFKYLEARETMLLSQRGRRAAPGTASISLEEFEAHGQEILRHKMNGSWDWLKTLAG